MRQEIKELNDKLDLLTDTVQRHAFEVQRDWEIAEKDREIQRLRLQNAMLCFERGLPPGDQEE